MCPFGLTCAAGGRGPGCTVLVGIVVRYTRLYINGGIMGASLIDVVLMGPPPQCSGLYIGDLVCIVIFSFGVTAVPCLEPGRVAPDGGGTTFGFGAQDSSTHSLECERCLCIILLL